MINAIYLYRFSRFLYLKKIPCLPKVVQGIIFLIYNCHISYLAKIGRKTFFLHKGMGTLIVETDPPGATVLIANENRGTTPLELNLIAGYYPMWIVMKTYETIFTKVKIQPEKAQRWVVELEEGKTVLAFDIQRNASVYLDGVHLVDLPTVIPWPVRSGKHVIVIENQDQNYHREMELDLLPGEVVRIDEETK